MHKILWPDQFLVSSRSDLGGLLCDPVEELSSRRRLAPVEAEDEFVEVISRCWCRTAPWCVPSIHRLSRETARWTLGSICSPCWRRRWTFLLWTYPSISR